MVPLRGVLEIDPFALNCSLTRVWVQIQTSILVCRSSYVQARSSDPMPSPFDSLIASSYLVDLAIPLPNSRFRFQAVLFPSSILTFGFSAVSNPSQTACVCVGLAGYTRGSSAFTIVPIIQFSRPRSAIVSRSCQAWQICLVSCASFCPLFLRQTRVCATFPSSLLLF